MSDAFDKILSSRPVNKQAARVMGRGVHFVPNKKIDQSHWSAPPVTIQVSSQASNPSFQDQSGKKFGRFTVVGYLGAGRWLCRCSCGDYETRRQKAILNRGNFGDRCDNCRHLSFLKRRAEFDRNPSGKQSDDRDL